MAYTFLDNSLTTRGVLTNKGGQKNNYWGDTITHEIATSQDVLTSVSLSVDKPTVNIDTTGNQKTWNHVIQGLSFNIDGIGAKVNENDYLIYQEGYNGRQYLMAITQVEESAVDSGIHYKTVQGLNAAAYDLSRKTLKPMTFAQNPNNNQTKGTPANILKYVFKDLSWDVRVIGNFGSVDYEITDGATSQSVLLDIISMFEAEVDGYIEKDNWQAGSNAFTNGGAIKRIFEFTSSLGHYKGQTIRYNKNLVSITKTGARDSMYTKLYVQGNNINISDVNKGADFLVDDVANRKYNKLGAMSNPVTYLEGTIANSSIDNPTALLAWGKKQLEILNHPRFNYSISATNNEEIQLGDTVIIQDTHASEPIFLKSKVISKNVSLADPFNNSFIVGEFSPIVIGADNGLEDTAKIMQLVNKANQTANDAIVKANENIQKIEDTRTNLEKTIDDKLQEGQEYADSLNDKAIEEQTKFNTKINQELATAKSERDALSTKGDQMIVSANSYADTMYNNAVSTAKTEASKALSDANTALSEAKTDLTTNLNKETEDRNQAVSAVNSQAQDYATQAKSDAIAAAKTADGQVKKDFKETADSLSSTISQNKEYSDGKISTAQTTATQALNGLTTKVSQTDYNKKTGKLQTDLTETSQTANQAKTDIVAIKSEADSQSAQINDIVSDAEGTTQTISDIKTAQGKQSGNIATLKSRADGFDASIKKINNFVNSQGQINQLINTEFNPDLEGWELTKDGGDTRLPYRSYLSKDINATTVGFDTTKGATNSWSNMSQRVQLSSTATSGTTISLSWSSWAREVANYNGLHILFYDDKDTKVGDEYKEWTTHGGGGSENSYTVRKKWENITVPDTATYLVLLFQAREGTGAYLAQPMLVFGSTIGDYVQGNYNNNGALAKVKLTADQAALDLSTYQKNADGRIKKAQSDITATANAIKAKVSQSDYNTKTNDLTNKYGQVKATADAVTTDVAKYKKSNDGRVSTTEANIETLNNQITSKVSQTDFDKTTGDLSGNYTETKQTVKNISNTVTELQAKANALGQINQLMNTEFTPDLEGWDSSETSSGVKTPYRQYIYQGSNMLTFDARNQADKKYSAIRQTIPFATSGGNRVVSLSWMSKIAQGTGLYGSTHIRSYDENMTRLSDVSKIWNSSSSMTLQKFENIAIPDEAQFVEVTFAVREGYLVFLTKPMLVYQPTVGDYVQGNYNNNSRVSSLEVGLDNISGLVTDPKNGLSATATLAANGLSVATKAQNDATTAIQTAKGIQTTVDSMGQVNQLMNTEFNPDLEGWEDGSDASSPKPYVTGVYPSVNARVIGFKTGDTANNTYARFLQWVSTGSDTPKISLSWMSYASADTTGKANIYLGFADSNGKIISSAQHTWINPGAGWGTYKWENISLPSGTRKIKVSFEAIGGVAAAYFGHPMLVFGSTVGAYVPGNYNNNATVKSIHTQTAGQITDEIEDRKSGDESVVTQVTGLIDQRVRSVTEGYESAISQSANAIMLSVSTPNNIINSEFENDLKLQNNGSGIDGWTIQNPSSGNGKPATIMNSNGYKNSNGIRINAYSNNVDTADAYYNMTQSIKVPHYVTQVSFNMMGYVYAAASNGTTYINMNIEAKGPTGDRVGWIANSGNLFDTNKIGSWQEANNRLTNMTIPNGTDSLIINFYIRGRASVNFSQPILTFTSGKSEYTRGPRNNLTTNSVLQMQSDNFSLNLHTNSQNIITSINGDHNGVTITGKQLTLDGNTTVTGDFYAKGGNFKNINASNITTGTINASKIKVINLDVKNLSGDVTNFIQSHWNGKFGSTTIDSSGITVSVPGSTSKFNSAGMETAFNKGSFVVHASTRDSGKSSGILLGMKDGATYTSFGFDSGSGYKDEMIITQIGSPAAKSYNIGGGVAFNHNVSLMDNVYMKPGKGFFSVWGNENRAIFFNTINAGIPAIVSPSGAGLAFGHGGQLYLLSHGIYQNIDDKKDRGGFKFDHPNVLG